MAINVYETHDSRGFKLGEGGPTMALKFVVTGTTSELEVDAAIRNVVPATADGLFLLNVSADPKGGGVWEGSANYGIPRDGTAAPGQSSSSPPPPPQPPPPPADEAALGPEWDFDTSGGTVKISQSLETRQKQAAPGPNAAPDNRQAIGAGKKGVEGCDILVPKFDLSTSRTLPTLSLRYIRTLIEVTGTTNKSAFWGFKPGELLFMGATGKYVSDKGWSLAYKFGAAKNEDSFKVGNSIQVSKRGWDYVWVLYEDVEDANFLIPRPIAAYVERVYPESEFSKLMI